MKKTGVKLLCVLTVLAFALTGCSLIGVDAFKEAQENFDNLKEDYGTVLAKYDGGEITMADVAYDYNNQYSYMYYMYQVYGYTFDQSQAEGILQDVVESHMSTRAVLNQADKLGITLTDEEKAECAEAAQAAYDEAYATASANSEGDTEEMKALNTEFNMYSMGETMDFYTKQQEWSKIIDKVEEVTKAEVTEVDEANLETLLTEHAIEDEQTYTDDLAQFEQDMCDENIFIAWRPEGYRTVKHILFKFADDDTELATVKSSINLLEGDLADLNDEMEALDDDDDTEGKRTAEEIQADIDTVNEELAKEYAQAEELEAAAIAKVQDKLDEVYARLEAGEDFDALMAEYGEDPGMQKEPSMTTGYYVCADSTTWDGAFKDAAMSLENVGDYTLEPVVSSSGVHIVYYASDVVGGQLQLADCHDDFVKVALEDAKTEHMNEMIETWVSELKPSYSIDKYFD